MTLASTRPAMGRIALLLACAVLSCLALAEGAQATTFTVNDARDSSDTSTADGICDAIAAEGGQQCTFRAAAEQANASNGSDIIDFISAFSGSTLQIGSPVALGVLESPYTVTVEGCATNPSSTQPCVGIRGTANPRQTGLQVLTANATIRGIALTNFDQAIFDGAFGPGLTLRNTWLGVRVNGTAEGNNTGITLTGDNGIIGGAGATSRNLISANGTGIRVFASNNGVILGNRIGTRADGEAAAGYGNGIGISVAGNGMSAGGQAENLTIGGELTPGGQASLACDEACNLISGNGTGIDLGDDGSGAFPASVQTANIAGNYIGYNPNGGQPATEGGVGIEVKGGDNVTIGATSAAPVSVARRNLIAAGGIGIRSGFDARNLAIRTNHVGANFQGTGYVGSLQGSAIDLVSAEAAPATVATNLVQIGGQEGIRLRGRNAQIVGNFVGIGANGTEDIGRPDTPGTAGINVHDTEAGRTRANSIYSNFVGNAGLAGIKLQGTAANIVTGNVIGTYSGAENHGNGQYGVLLYTFDPMVPTVGNRIGGPTTNDQNWINNNGEAAIGFMGYPTRENTIERVAGQGNGGGPEPADGFIDVGVDGPGNTPAGPQEGVAAPRIVAAGTAAIAGTGKPGARIRVYVKQSAAPGEVSGMSDLSGTVTVGSDGAWSAVYLTQPPEGTVVAATQTTPLGSTSELSPVAVTAAPDEAGTPPDTFLAGPAYTGDTTPTMSVSADREVAGFVCRVDGYGPWVPCAASWTVPWELSHGNHIVRAAALDSSGRMDPTPASFVIAIDTTPPPTPVITGGPEGPTTERRPTFSFSWEVGNEAWCQIDDGPKARCEFTYTPPADLAPGAHAFSVWLVDGAGNQGDNALREFTVEQVPGGGGGGGVGGADGRTPETTILKAPRPRLLARGAKAKAKLKFASSVKGSSFRCTIDRRPARPCSSPLKLKLRPGKHRIAVQAVGPDGTADPTPAVVRTRVRRP